MLSASAYSFRQQCRLAISLSWIGGYTNVVALMAFGVFVSHVTGTMTGIGRFLVSRDFGHVSVLLLLVASFFVGTLLSALLTEGARRRGMSSKFVMPVALELLLLLVFAFGFSPHAAVDPLQASGWEYALMGMLSAAMGIQNATITRISGSVVRTTHLTGVVTDFGLEGVQYLYWWYDNWRGRGADPASRLPAVSRQHPTGLRLALLVSIFGSFLFGVTMGALVFTELPGAAMVPPVLFLGWIIFVDVRTPIADVRELDLRSDPEVQAHGLMEALLPPEIGIYRSTGIKENRAHRAPDFQLWLDRVPAHYRVVILCIHPGMQFTANAVLDLEVALMRLHQSGRKLIISGVTNAQFRALEEHSVGRMMDVSNLCPDLEFAIARSMAALHHLDEAERRRQRLGGGGAEGAAGAEGASGADGAAGADVASGAEAPTGADGAGETHGSARAAAQGARSQPSGDGPARARDED